MCLYFLTGKDLLVPACLKESLSVRFCHWSSPLLPGTRSSLQRSPQFTGTEVVRACFILPVCVSVGEDTKGL